LTLFIKFFDNFETCVEFLHLNFFILVAIAVAVVRGAQGLGVEAGESDDMVERVIIDAATNKRKTNCKLR
jgi:hypothetical protein